jgi:hypothetical protein
MADYIEIENTQELRRLNRELTAKLKKAFHHRETRIVGSPGGNFSANVRFLHGGNNNIFWWAERPHREKGLDKNLFGQGVPGSNHSLNMDVQFNVPIAKFSRRSGGAFLRHEPTGRIVLAHRGIVTIGHGRVEKDFFFAKMHATRREASTSNGTGDFLLIGEMEAPTLVSDIDNFALQVRSIVQTARLTRTGRGKIGRKTGARTRNERFAKLRGYFDEFTGTRLIKGRRQTIADCYHGHVVRAIRDALGTSLRIYKSREIDLVIGLEFKRAFVFEAKTSTDTQSVYTAVGQLAVHSPMVARFLPGVRLSKVVVLPELPSKELLHILTRRLQISVLTFTRSQRGQVTIDGLEKLLHG